MYLQCYKTNGTGLGLGKGQKYKDGVKIAG